MILEGVVTNVTNFGAFVDIGVHRTAWCTSRRCRKSSSGPARGGQGRRRGQGQGHGSGHPAQAVGLSMRMSDTPGEKVEGNRGGNRGNGGNRQQQAPRPRETAAAPANNAMAALFANAKQLKKK